MHPHGGFVFALSALRGQQKTPKGQIMYRKRILRTIIPVLFALLFATAAQAQLAGTMQYNKSAGRMEFFDGLQWYYFAASLPAGSCSQPGSMDYNTLLNSFETCNGTVWTLVGGTVTLNTCPTPGMIDYIGSSFQYCNGLVWVDLRGPVVSS
jgi:hypothetical protein